MRSPITMPIIRRFHAIIDCIRANGMEPMCTLHHFTHPQWFEEMGGFTKEENIPIFVSPPMAGRHSASTHTHPF